MRSEELSEIVRAYFDNAKILNNAGTSSGPKACLFNAAADLNNEGYEDDQDWRFHEFTHRYNRWAGSNIWFPAGRRRGRIHFTKPHLNYYIDDSQVYVEIPRWSQSEKADISLRKLILLAWGKCCADFMEQDYGRKVNPKNDDERHQWDTFIELNSGLKYPDLNAMQGDKFFPVYTALLEKATEFIRATGKPGYASIPTTPLIKNIKLRPRHLARLDMYIQAVGMGLSHPGYVMGYNACMRKEEVNIFEKIRKGMISDDTSFRIEVTDSLEDICKLCPKKEEPTCVDRDSKLHDNTIAGVYKAEIGKKYTPKELLELLSHYHANHKIILIRQS